MSKSLPILGILFCLTVSSCALYQEIFSEKAPTAQATRSTANTSHHRLPNQADKQSNRIQQTTPATVQSSRTQQTTPATAQSNRTQQTAPQTPTANPPQPNHLNTAPSPQPTSTAQASEPSHTPKPKRTTPLLPANVTAVCYNYINICDDPPEGKVINTKSDEFSLIVNDNDLVKEYDYSETDGLKVSFKDNNDKYYKTYIHKAIEVSGGSSVWCTNTYHIVDIIEDDFKFIKYSRELGVLSYLIARNEKCTYNEYDDHDRVIGTREETSTYEESVLIDTIANVIVAEYISFRRINQKAVRCTLTSDNKNWIYKCDDSAPVIQPITDGGFYQTSLGERQSYSTVQACMLRAQQDALKVCKRHH